MSGSVPDYIRKGCYALVGDRPAVVSSYFFTSEPSHNCDALHVIFEGVSGNSANQMKPLPAQNTPNWLIENAVVSVQGLGTDRTTRVQSFWGLQHRDQPYETTLVKTSYFTPLPIECLTPACEADIKAFEKEERVKMQAARAFKRQTDERFGRLLRGTISTSPNPIRDVIARMRIERRLNEAALK